MSENFQTARLAIARIDPDDPVVPAPSLAQALVEGWIGIGVFRDLAEYRQETGGVRVVRANEMSLVLGHDVLPRVAQAGCNADDGGRIPGLRTREVDGDVVLFHARYGGEVRIDGVSLAKFRESHLAYIDEPHECMLTPGPMTIDEVNRADPFADRRRELFDATDRAGALAASSVLRRLGAIVRHQPLGVDWWQNGETVHVECLFEQLTEQIRRDVLRDVSAPDLTPRWTEVERPYDSDKDLWVYYSVAGSGGLVQLRLRRWPPRR